MQNSVNVTSHAKRVSWQSIDWRQKNRIVTQLRQRIFRASEEGDVKRARNLQKLMMRSEANRLLAVRRVTQLNRGRRSAGVDQMVVQTNAQREALSLALARYTPQQVSPVKRKYIRKSNGKKRPLGLPTILDRCQQFIIKSALEPYWEAQFEACSYGFRPGRSAHDAIEHVYLIARHVQARRWALKVDIKGAFDHVSHKHIANSIGNFPGRQWINQWLKAGVMQQGEMRPTWEGTPQGGLASPTLLNIALNGMEEAVGVQRTRAGRLKPDSPALVRYADDCVVIARTKNACHKAKKKLVEWLTQRGLELSMEKTQIVHLKKGFNFLGFNVKRYQSRSQKGKAVCLMQPSHEAIQVYRKSMKSAWKKVLSSPLSKVIATLNPKIRGWSQYFRIGTASAAFSKMDDWMWRRETRFLYRRHPHKNWRWKRKQYWGKAPLRGDRWVFMDKTTGKYLWKMSWTPIWRHAQVRGRASPDDPRLRAYWVKRQTRKRLTLSTVLQTLWRRQKGTCLVCQTPLDNETSIDKHHIKPKKLGGDDRMDNLCLVHTMCHIQIHARGLHQPSGARRLLEPSAG